MLWSACGPALSPAPGRAETSTTEPPGSTASDAADASADGQGLTTELTSGSTTESTGSESGTTGFCVDVGEAAGDCDPWAQDCPACQKCVWYANDGTPPWNATRCRALPPEPRGVGETCTLEGNQHSGVNDCDLGAMCWDLGPEPNAGVCAALCTGSREDPGCPDDSRCTVVLGSEAHLCIPTCDPLRGSCPGAGACVFVDDAPQGFVCVPPALVYPVDLGAPCSDVGAACGEATVCAPRELAFDCLDPVGCCAAWCDLEDDSSCARQPGTSCAAWPLWSDGAPPGYVHVGVCLAP